MARTPSTWAAVVVIWLMALAAELAVLARAGILRGQAVTGDGLVGVSFSLWQLLAAVGIPLAAAAVTWLRLRERGQ